MAGGVGVVLGIRVCFCVCVIDKQQISDTFSKLVDMLFIIAWLLLSAKHSAIQFTMEGRLEVTRTQVYT